MFKFINGGLASATLISSAIFLLVKTGHRSLFIFLPRSDSCLRTTLCNNVDLRSVFVSKKIADDIKVAEAKPPLKNQQCVVFKLKFDLCDADYVGYTCRHLFQRIKEHKHSAIGKHL